MVTKRLSAFSLLEVALVLCIMGIVLSFGLPSLIQWQNALKQKETTHNIENILSVLANFALQTGYLPNASTSDVGSPHHGYQNQQYLDGIVPYKTLHLRENDVKDAFGRWILYSVGESFVKSSRQQALSRVLSTTTSSSFCQIDVSSSIKNPLRLQTQDGRTIYEKGMGGDYLAVILTSTDQKNSSLSGSKNSSSMHRDFIENSPRLGYQIRWVTRNNLIAVYGKMPCVPG